MYTQFFNLKQAPFSIAPDPRYLFMSERHREALAHLLYGVGSGGGFVLLTGEIGAGKTTVCRCFLEQIPENCKVAYIFNPKLSVEELLRSICDEFHIGYAAPGTSGGLGNGATTLSIKTYVDALNAYLLATHAKGQNNVLIIDEAQNLSPAVLEQLRLLTNLETNERKLLQIILIGQPELRAILARPELEQLAQRVIARYHLGPLSVDETSRYILHRLGVGGLTAVSPFPQRLMQQIHRLTEGVPRRINLLCDRALLGAYAESKHQIDRGVVQKAAQEVFGKDALPVNPASQAMRFALLGLLLGGLISGTVVWRVTQRPSVPVVAATPVKASAAAVAAMRAGVAVSPPASAAIALTAVPAPASAPAATLASEAAAGEADAAYRALAQLWGRTLPGAEPCLTSSRKNLRCYSGDGGLAELMLLDRPAVLTLYNDTKAVYYALLLGMDKDNATVRIGGQQQSISLAALVAHFPGEFTTMWSVPRRFRDEVVSGDRGADVDWIAAQLAQWGNTKKPPDNQVFDQELGRQVRAFQTAHKLKIDGVVGPKTYMRLNDVAGISEPRLLSNPGAPSANALPRK
jgi:general secretion pathway protein A